MDMKSGEWQGFAYAVRLAEERGAVRVLIQPRLIDQAIHGEVRPDIYAEMPSGPPLIIEVEDSTGKKFEKNGPRHRESALLGKAEFSFIIGPSAKGGCEKRLRQYFGDSVEIIYLTDLVRKYGPLGISSKPLPI